MKNVLIDLTSLDDNFSGIEHYALYITKEIIKNKEINVELIFKNKISHFTDEELENVKTTILYGKRFNVMFGLLPKYIDQEKPDYAIFLAFPPSFLWKPKKCTKVFSTIHDLVCYDVPKTMTFKSRIFFKKSIKHNLKISNRIITISDFTYNRIIEKFNYGSEKILKVYCASSMPCIKKEFDDIQKKYNLPNEYILGLSTVEPRKNFGQLISWMTQIWLENENIPDLVLVGRKGWKQDEIIKSVPEKLVNKIHFTGFADDEDIYSLYYYSKTFAFPSIYEGFGIPLLEALQAEKLPICSKIPVFEEVLGSEYPYMFSLISYTDFKEKLFSYFSNDNSKLLVNEKKILDKYSWDIQAKKIINEIS